MRFHLTASILVAGLFSTAVQASSHLLTVINDSRFTVASVSYSPPGSGRWFVMDGHPIEAGEGGQARIAMPASACVFDFRVRFKGQPTQDIRAWNVCRGQALHVGSTPPAGRDGA